MYDIIFKSIGYRMRRLVAPKLYTPKAVALRQIVTDILFYGLLAAHCIIAVHNAVRGNAVNASQIVLLSLIAVIFVSDAFIFNIVDKSGARVCYGRGMGLFFAKPIAFWGYMAVSAYFIHSGSFAVFVACISAFSAIAVVISALCLSFYFKGVRKVYVDYLGERLVDLHDPVYILERLIVSAVCVACFSALGLATAMLFESATTSIIVFTFAALAILALAVELTEFIFELKRRGAREDD